MGYSNRFILCILINGVPQKELANGEVHIPFGSTFSLRLRNRHNRNAAVQIYIDGENVSGEGYKVPANDKVDIHRFADKDMTFKFVDLDSPEAVEHGKNGPNPDKTKGTVEARFFLEKEQPKPAKVEHVHHYHPYPVPQPYPVYPYRPQPYWYSSNSCHLSDGGSSKSHEAMGTRCKVTKTGGVTGQSQNSSMDFCAAAPASYTPAPDLREGATVEGYVSGQRFTKTYMDLETDYVSVKLFLKGYDPKVGPATILITETEVHPGLPPEPTPSPERRFCETCGTRIENQSAKFCSSCGAKLSR